MPACRLPQTSRGQKSAGFQIAMSYIPGTWKSLPSHYFGVDVYMYIIIHIYNYIYACIYIYIYIHLYLISVSNIYLYIYVCMYV